MKAANTLTLEYSFISLPQFKPITVTLSTIASSVVKSVSQSVLSFINCALQHSATVVAGRLLAHHTQWPLFHLSPPLAPFFTVRLLFTFINSLQRQYHRWYLVSSSSFRSCCCCCSSCSSRKKDDNEEEKENEKVVVIVHHWTYCTSFFFFFFFYLSYIFLWFASLVFISFLIKQIADWLAAPLYYICSRMRQVRQ